MAQFVYSRPFRFALNLIFLSILVIFIFLLLTSFPQITHAGGPLYVSSGKPVRWTLGSVIEYTVDQGGLGPLSNAEATQMIEDAFRDWEEVKNSNLRFKNRAAPLPENITGRNYTNILSKLPANTNPIIFDDDGSITDLLFGKGARYQFLGFAAPKTSGLKIVSARAVFNGFIFDEYWLSPAEIYSTIMHEIGHFCGLDHSQFFRHLAYNGVGPDNIHVPVMFPTATDDDHYHSTLTLDDEVAFANLYPADAHLKSNGEIQGTVKRGTANLNGVNVIAFDVSDPLRKVISTVTGTFSPGKYFLQGLPPGQYMIMIEAIEPIFYGSSSVGQFAQTASSVSFKNPVKTEYYNTSDQAEESRSTTSVVKVDAQKVVTGINFLADPASLPVEEVTTILLPINTSYFGGISSYRGSYIHALQTSGLEKRLDIVFRLHPPGTCEVRLEAMIDGVRQRESFFSRDDEPISVHIAEGGHFPLRKGEYKIGIINRDFVDVQYEIQVSQSNLPLPTFTPVPTPTPVGTDVTSPLAADINQDGHVNFKDVFLFASEWHQSKSDLRMSSPLFNQTTEKLECRDLLLFIQAMRSKTKMDPYRE